MNDKKLILVVDDENDFTQLMEEILVNNDYVAERANTGAEALRMLQARQYDLVILDLIMPDLDGLDILRKMNDLDFQPPVIILTGDGRIETVVESIKLGAYDYLSKPLDWSKLDSVLRKALTHREIKGEVIRLPWQSPDVTEFKDIAGSGPKMQALYSRIERVLESDTTVYLLGEKGTGKELFARTIHAYSPRKDKPFISVSCSAIPPALIEHELFGYEEGAVSQGMPSRIGKIELAQAGTLYLDDIAELPMSLQVKLVQLLERGEFQRVGGVKQLKADFRLIVAATKDLEAAVQAGHFREDLFYKISVFPVTIPPLRDHIEDIPELSEHFRKRFNKKNATAVSRVSNDVLSYFMKYNWPGNIQELENIMERSLLNVQEDTLQPENLPIVITSYFPEMDRVVKSISLQKAVELTQEILPWKEIEKIYLIHTLKISNYNLSTTAAKLGIGRTTLYRKLQRYRIKVDKSAIH